MATEGKAIILYRCNLFFFIFRQHRWKTSHGISTKLGTVGRKWCRFTNAPKISGAFPQIWGAKKHQILCHFFRDFRTRHRISPERNVASTNRNANANLQCVPYKLTYIPWPLTPKRLRFICILWPTLRRPLRCNHQSCVISSCNYCSTTVLPKLCSRPSQWR